MRSFSFRSLMEGPRNSKYVNRKSSELKCCKALRTYYDLELYKFTLLLFILLSNSYVIQ